MTAVAFLVRINLPRELSSKYAIWFLFLLSLNREYILNVWSIISATIVPLASDPTSEGVLETLWKNEDVKFAMTGGGLSLGIYLAFSIERALFYSVTKQHPPKNENLQSSEELDKED